MKITAIKQQVKQVSRYSIFVDEAYSFSLSESALLKSGLNSGRELSPDELKLFKQESVDDKLYNRALRYVALRSRSTWEVESYLERKDASSELIADTIDVLTKLGLLNDAAYAASFVRDRQTLKPSSRRKVMLELKRKHIQDSDIQKALAENDFSDSTSIIEVIQKKRRQTKYQDNQKLMQYLARQGFSYGEINTALSLDSSY